MAELILCLDKDDQEEVEEVVGFLKMLRKNEKAYLCGLLEGLHLQSVVE